MSDQRQGGIAWTDRTWNPIRGCSRVSEGCRNCYAEGVAARFSGPGLAFEGLARRTEKGLPQWTGSVRLVNERLGDPLRWRVRQKVFVNSVSDLFHEHFTNEQIAAVFGVMARAWGHTFQVLTKRPQRMREWFAWMAREVETVNAGRGAPAAWICLAHAQWESDHKKLRDEQSIERCDWPLHNVWLGVSVEDQATADARIPLLLDTPATQRFVSAEPLLGSLDLTPWMPAPRTPWRLDQLENRWASFPWPEWIPLNLREQIEKFWLEPWGRGPHAWIRDMASQGAPAFGERATLYWMKGETITGRVVHTWNNMARVLLDDGTWRVASYGRRWKPLGLDWAIVGGESGPRARPFDPEWALKIVEACLNAGTAPFVKQMGARPVGLELDDGHGSDWSEWPEALRVRHFPAGAR